MKYEAIFKLRDMLEEAKIPYVAFIPMMNGYKLQFTTQIDAIEHDGSIGHEDDLLEIQGALTRAESNVDSVTGCLTAEEVFERFKYCYNNKTTIYAKPVARSLMLTLPA